MLAAVNFYGGAAISHGRVGVGLPTSQSIGSAIVPERLLAVGRTRGEITNVQIENVARRRVDTVPINSAPNLPVSTHLVGHVGSILPPSAWASATTQTTPQC